MCLRANSPQYRAISLGKVLGILYLLCSGKIVKIPGFLVKSYIKYAGKWDFNLVSTTIDWNGRGRTETPSPTLTISGNTHFTSAHLLCELEVFYLFLCVCNLCFTCRYSTGYLQDWFLYKCLNVCLFAQLSLFPLRCILRLRSGYGWSLSDCCCSMR